MIQRLTVKFNGFEKSCGSTGMSTFLREERLEANCQTDEATAIAGSLGDDHLKDQAYVLIAHLQKED